MEISELKDWFTLTANLGVLLGIFFLIVEVKQNTAVHESDSRKALLSYDQTSLIVALDHHDVFKKWENLSHFPKLINFALALFLPLISIIENLSTFNIRVAHLTKILGSHTNTSF
jgi:hypothetical protein